MADMPSISLPAESMVEFSGFHVTNSVLSTLLVTLFIVGVAIVFRTRLQLVPGRFQLAMEGVVSFFYDQLRITWKDERRAKRVLPLMVALFLLILIGNQFSLIPLVSSVVKDGVQVLRTPTSDLSLTIGLAVLMVVGAHVIAFARYPLRHLGNFFKFHRLLKVRSFWDLFNTLIEVFLGLLDIVGEMAKILSMSFRLFGNIFAGEVMVAVISWLTAYFIPMPFIFLSAFSGIVQAFVFTLLAVNFSAGIIQSSEPAAAH